MGETDDRSIRLHSHSQTTRDPWDLSRHPPDFLFADHVSFLVEQGKLVIHFLQMSELFLCLQLHQGGGKDHSDKDNDMRFALLP